MPFTLRILRRSAERTKLTLETAIAEGIVSRVRRTPTIVTLRAPWADQATPGDWFAVPAGRVAFRVLEVLRTRIVCARYSRADLPAGVKPLQWPEVQPHRAPPPRSRVNRRDHLQRLLRSGVITERQFAAAVRLRDTIERALPSLPTASLTTTRSSHVIGAAPVHDGHLHARRSVERAIAAIGPDKASALHSVVINNQSIARYAAQVRVREVTAADRLCSALSSLDAWYNPPVTGPSAG